jgi:hypothetical protein
MLTLYEELIKAEKDYKRWVDFYKKIEKHSYLGISEIEGKIEKEVKENIKIYFNRYQQYLKEYNFKNELNTKDFELE